MTVIKQDQLDGGQHRLGPMEIEDFDRRAEAIIRDAGCRRRHHRIRPGRGRPDPGVRSGRTAARPDTGKGWSRARPKGGPSPSRVTGSDSRRSPPPGGGGGIAGRRIGPRCSVPPSRDVVELAAKLSGQIVHRTVRIDSGIIRTQLESAMGLVRSASDLVIVISPDDEPLVAELPGDLLGAFGNCRDATIRIEPGLAPGGCRIELDGGVIDASLETQLQRMAELMLPDEPVQQVADADGA